MAEKEYIEREAVYDMLNHIGGWDATDEWSKGWDQAINTAVKAAEKLPAADVVSAVRCKDCAHRPLCCRIIRAEGNRPDDFCSYGERRNGNG